LIITPLSHPVGDQGEEDHLIEKVRSCIAHFDSRVFNVPNRGEALNNLIWRSLFDCRRNSVFALAQAHFSAKQLHGIGTTGLINKLKTEKVNAKIIIQQSIIIHFSRISIGKMKTPDSNTDRFSKKKCLKLRQ
jgi:hypothetical protein